MNAKLDLGIAEDRISALSSEKMRLLTLLLEEKARSTHQIQRLPREKGHFRAPASAAQQSLWLLDQLGQAGPAYNIHVGLRLRGPLNQATLKAALDALVLRHDILRTVFSSSNGDPVQEVAPEGSFALEILDLQQIASEQQASQARSSMLDEAQERFDLGAGPLIRGRLLVLSAQEHVLLLTMHHIVCDGWSMRVLIQELAQLYQAFQDGRAPPLRPLPIQYADYAHWQRQSFQDPTFDGHLNYWRTCLEGAPPQLELPTDRPRPVLQSYRGDSVRLNLDARLSAGLRSLAHQQGLTLFMVLHAGWTILLSRLSGQKDIVVGTPVANRQRPELEGLIGLFVNTLVLRTQASGETRLSDLLQHVKEQTLEAYAHQDVPFETVVEALQPQRSPGRNPVFQVMFGLQSALVTDLEIPGLQLSREDDLDATAMFDLSLSMEDRGNEIAGSLGYASDLFERRTIERWVECLETLLRAMVGHGQRPIEQLPIVRHEERRQVLELFNATREPYPQDELIHALFERQVESTPDTVAVVYEGHSLTYAEINRKANQLARHLRSKGIGPDQLVGVCVERSLEMVIALLGILKAGGAYVPLDPNYPPERLANMLSDAAPKVLLIQGRSRQPLTNTSGEVISLDEVWPDLALQPSGSLDAQTPGLSSRHLAYVIYTSGSTGQPKGVMIEHRNVLNLWQGLENAYRQSRSCQRIALNASLNFDASVQQLVQLLSGRTLVVTPQEYRRDPLMLLGFLARDQIESIDCTPSQLKAWITAGLPMSGQHSLRVVLVGGEPIDAALWKTLAGCDGITFHNVYGPTECTVDTTLASFSGDTATTPHIGRPMANRRIYILDACRQPVPIAVPGEIYVGGAGVGRGYLNRPELSTERFVPDPFSDGEQARMYRTGDLGRWRADGTIEYLGRNDHQVKIRGFRIELGEIESQLARHQGVKEAAVLAREDIPGEKRLVAYVSARSQGDGLQLQLNVVSLRSHLKAILPEHMVPSAFVILEQFPITPSGKLDRQALPAPELGAGFGEPYEPPQGDLEEALAQIWKALLHLPRVGRQDNFFELGGHSLHGMRLVTAVTETLGVRLPGYVVFQHPTLEAMAREVMALRAENPAPASGPPSTQKLERHHPAARAPLTFTQTSHWRSYQLGERPSARQVASATRLRGRLSISVLSRVVTETVRRHDGLRIRIALEDGVPIQEVTEGRDYSLKVEDLTAVAIGLERAIRQEIRKSILGPVNPAVDPLFEIKLLRLRADEHVLVIAMDHLISDAFSLGILTRELLTGYAQALRGFPPSLPTISTPYIEYAHRQRTTQEALLHQHEEYWREHLNGLPRVRFPGNEGPESTAASTWATIPLRIDVDLRRRLNEWSRLRRTTLAMTVFTAYVGLTLRWCGASEAVFSYQTNSRDEPSVRNTIGYFASSLYLRLELPEEGTFTDLLNQVTDEYCEASAHADGSYLEAQVPRPAFTRNTCFNWIPASHENALPDLDGSDDALVCSPVSFRNPILETLRRDTEPLLEMFDTGSQVMGDIYFPLDRVSVASMERFVDALVSLISILPERSELPLSEIALL